MTSLNFLIAGGIVTNFSDGRLFKILVEWI